MKAVVCLMFACVLMASTVHAQAPAPAQGGQKIPLHEGLRRSYNNIKLTSRSRAEARRSRLQLPPIARHPRLWRAAGALPTRSSTRARRRA